MSKSKKIANVPKLRFPEFQNLNEWQVDLMCNHYNFLPTNSFSRDKLNYESGLVKNIHYGDIHKKFNTLFKLKDEDVPFINETESLEKIKPESYCKISDLVFADASEDLQDIGKSIELIDLNNEKVLSGLHTILARPKHETFCIGFSGYLFKSTPMRSQIQKEAQGAKVLGISAKKLANINLTFPTNKVEQQKIADCLSSLDNLISVQTQKLEILKSYKRTFLKQLFPQEGETVPRLRFPNFNNDGNWEFLSLGDIGEVITGNTPRTSERDNYNGEIMFVSPADIGESRLIHSTAKTLTEKGFSKARHIPAGSVLFVCIGSTIGKVAQASATCATNQQINSIVPYGKYSANFIYSVLQSSAEKISDLAGRQAVPLINKSQFSDIKIFVPTFKEQEKVANFLLSLDAIIESQNKKEKHLKVFKNGLLQQLFPSSPPRKKGDS
jgi:type I restriction enzyme S subunit